MDNPLDAHMFDQNTARRLFDNGAFLIFIDFPVGSEFGIDYNSWNTDKKFKGVKMIPPGVHFVYFSVITYQQQSPRIGFFHDFKCQEILVKKWNKSTEDLLEFTASDEEIETFRSNLHDIDQYLAPYPHKNYKIWYSLANHINAAVIGRLNPLDRGRISSQSELISKEVQDLGESSQKVDRMHPIRQRYYDKQGLPILHVKPGTEIRFTNLELGRHSDPSAVSASDALLTKILCSSGKDGEDFLGEMQFTFVCFLLGHLYEAFEQWKRIIRLICSCSSTLLKTNQTFYSHFINCIYFQLKLTPTDFFTDIVSKANFLTLTLSNFFSSVDSYLPTDSALRTKATKFKLFLLYTYKWDFDDASDDPEPTVIEDA